MRSKKRVERQDGKHVDLEALLRGGLRLVGPRDLLAVDIRAPLQAGAIAAHGVTVGARGKFLEAADDLRCKLGMSIMIPDSVLSTSERGSRLADPIRTVEPSKT